MRLMGYLEDGKKVRKGRHQGGVGRNKQERTEVKGDKRIWLCVNTLLESALA